MFCSAFLFNRSVPVNIQKAMYLCSISNLWPFYCEEISTHQIARLCDPWHSQIARCNLLCDKKHCKCYKIWLYCLQALLQIRIVHGILSHGRLSTPQIARRSCCATQARHSSSLMSVLVSHHLSLSKANLGYHGQRLDPPRDRPTDCHI